MVYWTPLLLLLVSFPGTKQEYVLDRMPAVVDQLWIKISDNWIVTTGSNLATFFSRYGTLKQKSLSLYEHSFTGGEYNFGDEFAEYGVTYEYSRAYFRSLDTVETWLYMRLTIEDMDTLVDMCDKYTNKLGLGFLSSTQFKKGFKEVIFHSLPFSLIYVRFDEDPLPVFKPTMNWYEFHAIFTKMDSNGNCKVTPREMGRFWHDGSYGPRDTGKQLFKALNYKNETSINISDWQDLFDDIDCVTEKEEKDGKLSHREFIQLHGILHGSRPYPLNGECHIDNGMITLPKQNKNKQTSLLKLKEQNEIEGC